MPTVPSLKHPAKIHMLRHVQLPLAVLSYKWCYRDGHQRRVQQERYPSRHRDAQPDGTGELRFRMLIPDPSLAVFMQNVAAYSPFLFKRQSVQSVLQKECLLVREMQVIKQ